MLSNNVLYYGKDEPLPERQELRAGPLTLIYEAGDLRYIKLGDHEILRRVYVAIRDRNWNTLAPALSNLEIDATSDSFRISYNVENKQGDVDFFWNATITGDAQGTIIFSMDGVARSTFLRNRIGFCVLHPMRECAGAPCQIEHVDGTLEDSTFPRYICPQSIVDGMIQPCHPLSEMRALSYGVMPGVSATVRFDGEIFETEDQRNWTDASFKTYGTPLRLPFPARVESGTRIAQTITLTLNDQRGTINVEQPTRSATPGQVSFTVDSSASARPLPRLGLGLASHGQPLTAKEIERLKALNLDHLRVDLHLSQPDYPAELRRATDEARALGVRLEVALLLGEDAASELAALCGVLEQVQPPTGTWLIFHSAEKTTGERWLQLARAALTKYDPAATIGGGTNVYFTELNRTRPPIQALDQVSYSINPQVHAFDNASLVETLAAQTATVESARQFCGDRPLAISPVTLKPRFNPNATGPEPEPALGQLPAQVDERQMSLLGAGWTLGSLKYLAESGVPSVTYYETSGWRGVMETEQGSPLPDAFQSLPGAVFPLYHVLADISAYAGGDCIPSTSSDTLRVDGLALSKDDKSCILIANLSPQPQQVMLSNLSEHVRVRYLDERNAEEAMRDPESFRARPGERLDSQGGELRVDLFPYALARIDQD